MCGRDDENSLINLHQRVRKVIREAPQREAASGEDKGEEILPRDHGRFLEICAHVCVISVAESACAELQLEMSYKIGFVELEIEEDSFPRFPEITNNLFIDLLLSERNLIQTTLIFSVVHIVCFRKPIQRLTAEWVFW